MQLQHTTLTLIHADDIEVLADLSQASAGIKWRPVGKEQWHPTPFQTADARHDGDRAAQLVSEWIGD